MKRVHYKPQNTPKTVTDHSVTSQVEKNASKSKEKEVEAEVNATGTEGVRDNSEKHTVASRSGHCQLDFFSFSCFFRVKNHCLVRSVCSCD